MEAEKEAYMSEYEEMIMEQMAKDMYEMGLDG
jgi:hypothetical protein